MTKATDPRNTSTRSEDISTPPHRNNSVLTRQIHHELIRAKALELPERCKFVVNATDWTACIEVHNIDPIDLVPEFGHDDSLQMAAFKAEVVNSVARYDWTRPQPGRRRWPEEGRFRFYVHLVGFDPQVDVCHLCAQPHPTPQDRSHDRTDPSHQG